MSLIPGATGSTAKAVDGLEGASSGAPVVLPSGFQGSSRPSTLADADITLTSTSNPEMVMTPTATRTITLASTGVPANYVVRVINKASSFNILINSSAGNLVATVPGGSQATVMSNIASPTTAGNWNTNSYGDVFGPGSATDNAITRYDGTSGKLTQNSTATIDDSGNISATSLIVSGGTAANNTIYIASNQLRLRGGTSGLAVYNTSGTSILNVADAGVVTLGPSASSATNAVVNGAISQTHGVIFPATANISASANTLDDYEEGTFTPTCSIGSTYTTQTGIYTKIGNTVTFQIYIVTATHGAGNVTVGALPFTIKTGNDSACSFWGDKISVSGGSIIAYCSNGGTTININYLPTGSSGGSVASVTNSHVNTGFSIMLQGSYKTDS